MCELSSDRVGNLDRACFGFQWSLVTILLAMIHLSESPRGYPRRHPHSTVDAAVRLPYRKEEIRDRPQTDPFPVWGSPRRLEGRPPGRQTDPASRPSPPAMDRQGLRPREIPRQIGAGGRGLGGRRCEDEDGKARVARPGGRGRLPPAGRRPDDAPPRGPGSRRLVPLEGSE